MIKLIASDLDGTLLDVGSTVSEKTKQVLTKCDELGITFVPATSRGLGTLPQEVVDLATRYLILSNGAVVYDKELEKNAYENFLDFKSLDQLFELLEGKDYILSLSQGGIVYSEEKLVEMLAHGYPKVDYDKKIKFKDKQDIQGNIDSSQGIEKIHLNFTNAQERRDAYRILKQADGWSISTSWIDNIEITSLGVDKGSAVMQLEKMLNITSDETMTFGDGYNDISMLVERPYGVAMANGEDKVKQAASQVTRLTHDNDGFAVHIEENILKR